MNGHLYLCTCAQPVTSTMNENIMEIMKNVVLSRRNSRHPLGIFNENYADLLVSVLSTCSSQCPSAPNKSRQTPRTEPHLAGSSSTFSRPFKNSLASIQP